MESVAGVTDLTTKRKKKSLSSLSHPRLNIKHGIITASRGSISTTSTGSSGSSTNPFFQPDQPVWEYKDHKADLWIRYDCSLSTYLENNFQEGTFVFQLKLHPALNFPHLKGRRRGVHKDTELAETQAVSMAEELQNEDGLNQQDGGDDAGEESHENHEGESLKNLIVRSSTADYRPSSNGQFINLTFYLKGVMHQRNNLTGTVQKIRRLHRNEVLSDYYPNENIIAGSTIGDLFIINFLPLGEKKTIPYNGEAPLLSLLRDIARQRGDNFELCKIFSESGKAVQLRENETMGEYKEQYGFGISLSFPRQSPKNPKRSKKVTDSHTLVLKSSSNSSSRPKKLEKEATLSGSESLPAMTMDQLIESFVKSAGGANPASPSSSSSSSSSSSCNWLYMVYPAILTSVELITAVIKKFKESEPLKSCCLNWFSHWIENYRSDFHRDPEVHLKLIEFSEYLKEHEKEYYPKILQVLSSCTPSQPLTLNGLPRKELIGEALSSGDGNEISAITKGDPTTPSLNNSSILLSPKVSFPNNDINQNSDCIVTSILDIDPTELAKQLTIIEFALFSEINSWEFLHPTKTTTNIKKMVNWFNHLSNWVQTEILTEVSLKKRVRILSKFIDTCSQLLKIGNFSGVLEVISALESLNIHRLKNTWSSLPEQVRLTYQTKLQYLSNMPRLRDAILNKEAPVLPYIGLFLSELTQIDEGNPNKTSDGLINLPKYWLFARTLVQLNHWQKKPFNFQPIPPIQRYLEDITVIEDESTLSSFSEYLEPRQSNEPQPEIPPLLKEFRRNRKAVLPVAHHHSPNHKKYKSTDQHLAPAIMKEHMDTLADNTELMSASFMRVMEDMKGNWKGNADVLEILEKLQSCFSMGVTNHQHRVGELCKQTTSELDKVKTTTVISPNDEVRSGVSIQTLAQWLWQEDNGKLMSYDTPTTILIEAQYQKNPKCPVQLTHGSCGTTKMGYMIDFEKMLEIQCDSNSSRPVIRRINWISSADHKKKMYELQEKLDPQKKHN